MTEPLKLVLFIDAQNTYRGARESFFPSGGPVTCGQFNPVRLGELMAARGGPGGCVVRFSRRQDLYWTPGPKCVTKNLRCSLRQCAARESRTARSVIWRWLYPPRRTGLPAQEKGIDVALCIDFVAMAIDGLYDVGVIMSTDTDLLPALEFTTATLAFAISPWPLGIDGGECRCLALTSGVIGCPEQTTMP